MTKSYSRPNGQPQPSRFRAATGATRPSLSENPPALIPGEPPLSPSAGSAESTQPVTNSIPTQSPNTFAENSPELELLAQVMRTTVENLEALGLCWRTKTKDGEHLRVVFPLNNWTLNLELKSVGLPTQKQSIVADGLTWFQDSPDAGAHCLCSKCGHAITEADIPPVRLFDSDDNTEARFHVNCYGEWLQERRTQ